MSYFKLFFIGAQLPYSVVLFLLYTKVNHPYLYMYPLLFEFPPHLGQHRALSSVP